MYNCKICNFESNDSGNFSRHKQTKKHLENASKIDEVDLLKIQLKDKDKEIDKLEAVIKVYQEQLANTINNTQNNTQNNTINTSSINYVNQHYQDAPPLEKITNFVINGIDTNDASQHDKFIGDVIYYYNNKILHQLLGDHIISIYKKTDLSKQSFHTTDTSRLNYVVRIFENSPELYDEDSDSEDDRYNYINEETLGNEEKELFRLRKQYDTQIKLVNKKNEIIKFNESNDKKIWTTDKNGYKICKLLIDPTVKQLVTILKKRLKINNKKKIKNLDNEIKYYQSISNIIESFDTKKLKNDINKYIAPNFNLDKKHFKS
jgi:hypothetical protein